MTSPPLPCDSSYTVDPVMFDGLYKKSIWFPDMYSELYLEKNLEHGTLKKEIFSGQKLLWYCTVCSQYRPLAYLTGQHHITTKMVHYCL